MRRHFLFWDLIRETFFILTAILKTEEILKNLNMRQEADAVASPASKFELTRYASHRKTTKKFLDVRNERKNKVKERAGSWLSKGVKMTSKSWK